MSNNIDNTARSTRRPQLRVLAYASVLALISAVFVGAGSAASGPKLSAPVGLSSFMKRINDPRTFAANGVPDFSRTPSFAWKPVAGATRYEFELSTSDKFRAGNGLVWSSKTLTTPATAIPLSLPWITGEPASLYWRVRAVAGRSVSRWSAPRPFNMRWPNVPQQLSANEPGYVRWTPVDGATGYQVWFVRADKVIGTITNVADEREYYAFHDNPAWTGDVEWRVRAVRRLYGKPKDALPAVSYGPWSPTYHSVNPSVDQSGDPRPIAAVSDAISTQGHAQRHSLMPAFLFAGSGDTNYGLHRVYVFSDRDCVNVVYRGAIVGGPAYAPRTTGPLNLPKTDKELAAAASTFLLDGDEGDATYARDTAFVRTTEALPKADGSASSSSGSSAGAPAAATNSDQGATPKVDLWDRSWPGGRYYWTVVPVRVQIDPTGKVTYRETELPQDACAFKRILDFGKDSAEAKPADSQSVPYATGLSPNGRLRTARRAARVFYGPPLVAWGAAPAANKYDVEWSHSRYPWRPVGHVQTPATSAMLPLSPGRWWYRVRGINESVPGSQKMTWSKASFVRIAKPTFSVRGG